MKYFVFTCSLFFVTHAYAQDNDKQPPQTKFVYVDQMPKPNYDLDNYFLRNLRYPDNARKKKVEGRVLVQFVVTETGAIDSIKVMRGIGGGCDEEAERLIRTMPKWEPGKQSGRPARVCYTQGINFKLKD